MGINTRSGMTLKILVENVPLEYKYCSKTGMVYNVTPQKEMKFKMLPQMVKSFTDNSSTVYWDKCKKTIKEIVHKNVHELLRDEIKALTEALDKDCIPDESCMRRVEFTLKEGEKEVTVEKYIDVNSVLIYRKPNKHFFCSSRGEMNVVTEKMDGYMITYYLKYNQDIEFMLIELFDIFERKR